MRRFNKKVVIGALGVLVGAIVVAFLFLRDQVKLVSIKDFNALLHSDKIQSIQMDDNYIYLKVNFKIYKTRGWVGKRACNSLAISLLRFSRRRTRPSNS
ncbi:hypothetical protein [Helicobacter vulpis]|nr:hypothetical protein [Helicobacter vulpis]